MDVMAQVPLLEKVLDRFYRVMDGLGHPCSFGLFRSSPCFHYNILYIIYYIYYILYIIYYIKYIIYYILYKYKLSIL